MKAPSVAFVVIALMALGIPPAFAAGQASFSDTNSAVQQGFVAVQHAGNDGGNVTSLVNELNQALILIQKAGSENASNPAQATADLQSASVLAQGAFAAAPQVDQQGVSAREFQLAISIGSAVGIVGLSVALYFYGERIFHRLWLVIFRNHVVVKAG